MFNIEYAQWKQVDDNGWELKLAGGIVLLSVARDEDNGMFTAFVDHVKLTDEHGRKIEFGSLAEAQRAVEQWAHVMVRVADAQLMALR